MHDVITIGTATRDIFLVSKYYKVLNDAGHLKKIGIKTGEATCFALGAKIEVEKPIFSTGGGASNAALTFVRQGFKTAAFVKIGKDPSGEAIIEEFKKEKIKPIAVYNGEAATAYSTILLTPGGERTILVYRGASETLKHDEIPFDKLNSRWAYFVPGGISFNLIDEMVSFFSSSGALIALNPSRHLIERGLKGLKSILEKTKVLIVNREEASYLTGVEYENEKEIFRKFDEVMPGIAVMTDGSAGVLVSDGRKIYKAGIFNEKKPIDRTGAGDAFGSGFVAGLMHNREECNKGYCQEDNIGYAIRLGSANATSVVEKVGAKQGIIAKDEFKNNPRWTQLPIKISDAKIT